MKAMSLEIDKRVRDGLIGIVTLIGFTASFVNFQPTTCSNYNGLGSLAITINGVFSINVTTPIIMLFGLAGTEFW